MGKPAPGGGRELTSPRVACSLPRGLPSCVWSPRGRVRVAHTCTPRPCSCSTRARRAPIPLRRASRCSADETPRLARSLCRRAGQTPPAQPHLLLSLPLPGQGPSVPRLTARSWRQRPPGSRSPLQRSCPCSGPGPGPPAKHPQSQRRGRWRRHGPPGGWEAWGRGAAAGQQQGSAAQTRSLS